MRVVFLGTPEFAAKILEHVSKISEVKIVAVVSKPDAASGRGRTLQPTPVKSLAQKLLPGVPLFQPEKASTPEFVEAMKALSPDLFLIVAYGEIIKPSLLEVPRLGCYNIHASLLPAYRGAAPIQRALMDGCQKSGITIFKLTKGMDSGDIVWQESCPVSEDMNAGELTSVLLKIAKKGIGEAVFLLKTGKATFTPQHHEEATMAPKITQEDRLLDQRSDVTTLHDHIRALSPQPGAYFWVSFREQKMRLKVLESHVNSTLTDPHRRWLILDDGSLGLTTSSGTLVLDRVQLEGRAVMDIQAFLRGVPLSSLLFL